MTTSDQTMIAALRRERDTYERQGKKDRVKQVDDQLRHLGYTGDEDQGDSEPQGRTPQDPGQQTADAPGDQSSAAADAATATPAEAQAPAAAAPAKKAAAARSKNGT